MCCVYARLRYQGGNKRRSCEPGYLLLLLLIDCIRSRSDCGVRKCNLIVTEAHLITLAIFCTFFYNDLVGFKKWLLIYLIILCKHFFLFTGSGVYPGNSVWKAGLHPEWDALLYLGQFDVANPLSSMLIRRWVETGDPGGNLHETSHRQWTQDGTGDPGAVRPPSCLFLNELGWFKNNRIQKHFRAFASRSSAQKTIRTIL